MRRLLFATIAAIALTGPALAGDLPSNKEAPEFVPPPPVFTWTGFYIGLNGGGGGTDFSRVGHYDSNPVNDSRSSGGYFFGGQIGYNYQYSPNFVIGAEADFQGSKFNNFFGCGAGPYAGPGTCYDDSSVAGYDMDSFGTVRARIGYAMNNWLIYATGGFAWGDIRYTANDYIPAVGTGSGTAGGWTVGGGVEYAINNHWSLKAEYLYLDVGGVNIDPIPSYAPDYNVNVKATANIGRFGINYRF